MDVINRLEFEEFVSIFYRQMFMYEVWMRICLIIKHELFCKICSCMMMGYRMIIRWLWPAASSTSSFRFKDTREVTRHNYNSNNRKMHPKSANLRGHGFIELFSWNSFKLMHKGASCRSFSSEAKIVIKSSFLS